MQKCTVKVNIFLIKKLKEGVVFSEKLNFGKLTRNASMWACSNLADYQDTRWYAKPENPSFVHAYPRPHYAVPAD